MARVVNGSHGFTSKMTILVHRETSEVPLVDVNFVKMLTCLQNSFAAEKRELIKFPTKRTALGFGLFFKISEYVTSFYGSRCSLRVQDESIIIITIIINSFA